MKFWTPNPPALDAVTAAATLGVSRATLYAYVSRGLVSAKVDPADPRRRLYAAADVERLKRNQDRGRNPQAIATQALDWGLGALPSRITLVEGGRLFYRGHDSAALAVGATLETVASLLWECGPDDPFAQPAPVIDPSLPDLSALAPLDRCHALLPLFAPGAHVMWNRRVERLRVEAASLLRLTAACLLGTAPSAEPVHRQVAQAWRLPPEAGELVRAALVLMADHELNASTFAVRVVASTGASLPACLTAGLAALSGPLHGGATALAELLFEEVGRDGSATAVVAGRLRRGEALPGFGHKLYPGTDPRADFLLRRLPPDPVRSALIDAVDRIGGQFPNIDFATASLRRACGLPTGSALVLFALARTVGWIAHALEQHLDGKLIRPRAQYVGEREAGRWAVQRAR